MASSSQEGDGKPALLHIMVVGFHHQKGSTVEFVFPPLQYEENQEGHTDHVSRSLTSRLPQEWRHLPHLALPEGSHNYDQDSVYFILPLPSDPAGCVYGVACCRQVPARSLQQVDEEVTRSTVQKSVCVLCRFPTFRFIESKLELVTHAYFNTKDFSDVSILHEAYESMNSSIFMDSALGALHLGLSQRALALRYQHRLLQIVKALLLRKRVVVFGSPAEELCCTVLSIAALFPSSLEHQLNPQIAVDEYGFPLRVFDTAHSLQPYVCLQQMDVLYNPSSEYPCVLAGVLNPLFEKQQKRVCDVFVHVKQGLVYIQDPEINSQLHLTCADLRFCSHVTEVLQEQQDKGEPMTFHGSSEWVRAQYNHYLLSLLATSEAGDSVAMDEYNRDFASSWLKSKVFETWKSCKREGILRVEPKHPGEGDLSLGDVRRKLVARVSDYGLNVQSGEDVAQETQRVLTKATERVSSAVSGAWSTASAAVYSWWTGGGQDTEEHTG